MDKMKKEKVLMNGNDKLIRYRFNNSALKLVLLSIIILIILIVQTLNISAIGITPGRTTVNFESGLSKDIQFSIVNTEKKDMNVVFYIQGELNSSISLSQTFVKFSASEESKPFSYKINLPQKFDKPGLHTAEIVALEMPSDLEQVGTFIGARVAVISQLYVYAPYPNKYMEGELNIVDSEAKKVFFVPVINRGELDIVNVKAIIDIYTALNEKVATLETDTIPVASLERKEFSVEWIPNVNPGKYLAVVSLVYDNQVAEIKKEFNVGESLVDISDLYVRDFSLGEIAKFNALVENKWGNEIKDSFLNILVYNNQGEIMADFKSPTYNLKPLSKTEMVAYWDTGGVKQGNYDGKVLLKYGEKFSERNIQLKISDTNIEISGITGKVLVKGSSGKLNINNFLVIAVIVLILVNVVWFFVIRRFMKKRNK